MPKRKLLVTDDQRGVREALKLILEEDYAVVEAASGDEALRGVREQDVRIVFLDLMLPGMDGLEALERIKRWNQRVEVCIVTAVRDAGAAARAARLGAFDFLSKPFSVEAVREAARGMAARVYGGA